MEDFRHMKSLERHLLLFVYLVLEIALELYYQNGSFYISIVTDLIGVIIYVVIFFCIWMSGVIFAGNKNRFVKFCESSEEDLTNWTWISFTITVINGLMLLMNNNLLVPLILFIKIPIIF